jgi:hypothetical protein
MVDTSRRRTDNYHKETTSSSRYVHYDQDLGHSRLHRKHDNQIGTWRFAAIFCHSFNDEMFFDDSLLMSFFYASSVLEDLIHF